MVARHGVFGNVAVSRIACEEHFLRFSSFPILFQPHFSGVIEASRGYRLDNPTTPQRALHVPRRAATIVLCGCTHKFYSASASASLPILPSLLQRYSIPPIHF